MKTMSDLELSLLLKQLKGRLDSKWHTFPTEASLWHLECCQQTWLVVELNMQETILDVCFAEDFTPSKGQAALTCRGIWWFVGICRPILVLKERRFRQNTHAVNVRRLRGTTKMLSCVPTVTTGHTLCVRDLSHLCSAVTEWFSFFAGFSEGELAEINVLKRDRGKVTQEDDAERSFGEEDEDIISDNVQLELLGKHHSKDFLLAHLNINSVQNKFKELSAIIRALYAHIMFISETKIDASCPNAQFFIPGYFSLS